MTNSVVVRSLCVCVLSATMLRAVVAVQDAAEPDAVARFLSRHDPPLTSYRAHRRLSARNARFNVEGWLEAVTELSPDTGFTFRIDKEGGSGYIRNRVLKAALEGEQKMIKAGDPAKASLTPENYELTVGQAGDAGLLRLLAKPRRKDVLLVDGALFVNAADADLVRIEGRLSKSPSFWTRDVQIVRTYSRLNGVRVPTQLESVAKVRIAGTSSLTMTYQYEMVNGREVALNADAVMQNAK
jgi:hypothetical protein